MIKFECRERELEICSRFAIKVYGINQNDSKSLGLLSYVGQQIAGLEFLKVVHSHDAFKIYVLKEACWIIYVQLRSVLFVILQHQVHD